MVRRLSVNAATLNPATIVYVVNALVAMAVAWGWHATTDQMGAVTTIVTGVLTLVTVFTVRPVVLPTAAAAAVTVLSAFTAFHLHLAPNVIAATVAVASIALGFLLPAIGVPVVAAIRSTTATRILIGQPEPGSEHERARTAG